MVVGVWGLLSLNLSELGASFFFFFFFSIMIQHVRPDDEVLKSYI